MTPVRLPAAVTAARSSLSCSKYLNRSNASPQHDWSFALPIPSAASLAWLLAGFVVAYWFGKFIDGRNPMNRTRRLMNGRKSMASEWRKPTHLPEDWE